MNKDDILHYLNAKSEYTANVNLLNYTDQNCSVVFNNDNLILFKKNEKIVLKYNTFNKNDFENYTDI